MTKKEKVSFVIEALDKLYPEIPIPLDHKDPYTLLIAVLMSAQSTDIRVNQITPLLFKKADTPQKMIKLTVEEIREIIKPVGLSPMKSKGIHGLSHILINMEVKYPIVLKHWKPFPQLGIKRPVWSCPKPLVSLLFLWIPTFIGCCIDGVFLMVKM
jgi:endonuclease-3